MQTLHWLENHIFTEISTTFLCLLFIWVEVKRYILNRSTSKLSQYAWDGFSCIVRDHLKTKGKVFPFELLLLSIPMTLIKS